jgi:5-methylthioadenosine/S-adenosylhomocysteine deaminase
MLDLATLEGARAIGLGDEIGSLEPGKRGDLVVLDPRRPASFAAAEVSPADRIVPAVARDAVRYTVVDGEVLVDAGRLLQHDGEEILRRAGEEIESLVARAEIPG